MLAVSIALHIFAVIETLDPTTDALVFEIIEIVTFVVAGICWVISLSFFYRAVKTLRSVHELTAEGDGENHNLRNVYINFSVAILSCIGFLLEYGSFFMGMILAFMYGTDGKESNIHT